MNDRLKFRVPVFKNNEFDGHVYMELGEKLPELHSGYYGKPEQCTGLKDKNGNLIYEGDILKNGIHYYQVVWHAGKFVLNTGCKNYPISGCDLAEIVGNIHENGDLLR